MLAVDKSTLKNNTILFLTLVFYFRVCFPESVRWMCLEFDSQCCTAQVEDSLQLYLPSIKGREDANLSAFEDYWPVLSKFSGTSNWPTSSIILPGKNASLMLLFSSFFKSNF